MVDVVASSYWKLLSTGLETIYLLKESAIPAKY